MTAPVPVVDDRAPAKNASQHAVPPASAPVAPAAASIIGFVAAVAIVCLGVVAVRDALVATGLVGGGQWLAAAGGAVNGIEPGPWTIPVDVALAAVGVVFVALALKPRRRTEVPLRAETAVYLATRDVATVARVAAASVPGVLTARASASRRRVVVSCRTTVDAEKMHEAITDEVTRAMTELQRRPRVVVRTRSEKNS